LFSLQGVLLLEEERLLPHVASMSLPLGVVSDNIRLAEGLASVNMRLLLLKGAFLAVNLLMLLVRSEEASSHDLGT